MVIIAPLERAEMARRHAGPQGPGAAVPRRAPVHRNIAAVLDLGNTVYYTFRGRAYGVPPLPWKAGLRLLALWQQAQQNTDLADPAAFAVYRSVLGQLPALLWRHSRPVGPVRRALRVLGLHRNPLARASEGELADLLGFFLRRRLTSSTGLPPALPPRPTSMPSTN